MSVYFILSAFTHSCPMLYIYQNHSFSLLFTLLISVFPSLHFTKIEPFYYMGYFKTPFFLKLVMNIFSLYYWHSILPCRYTLFSQPPIFVCFRLIPFFQYFNCETNTVSISLCILFNYVLWKNS